MRQTSDTRGPQLWTHGLMHSAAYLAVGLGLSGCSTLGDRFGPQTPQIPAPATFKSSLDKGGLNLPVDRTAVTENATDMRSKVEAAGGVDAYVQAGYSYNWNACSRYFDALILMQNQNGYAGDVVAAASTATSAMVALRKNADDAAKSLARIAAGSAFVTTLLSDFDDRALMTPYPSETKSLILAALKNYEEAAPATSATSYFQAAILVERHAELCTYSGITRFAKQALAKAETKSDQTSQSLLDRAQQIQAVAVSDAFGLGREKLSDRQLALLYVYLVSKKPAFGTPEADKLLKELPPSVEAKLRENGGDVEKFVGRFAARNALSVIYDQNAAFKALAATVAKEMEPPPPAATPTPSASAAGKPKATAVPTPAESAGTTSPPSPLPNVSATFTAPFISVK